MFKNIFIAMIMCLTFSTVIHAKQKVPISDGEATVIKIGLQKREPETGSLFLRWLGLVNQ